MYKQLQKLLSVPIDQLSDAYIWSDGIITQGTKDVNDFIKLIESSNSLRPVKVRINTVSFLVGGSESDSARNEATQLLQTIADVTGGTFI